MLFLLALKIQKKRGRSSLNSRNSFIRLGSKTLITSCPAVSQHDGRDIIFPRKVCTSYVMEPFFRRTQKAPKKIIAKDTFVSSSLVCSCFLADVLCPSTAFNPNQCPNHRNCSLSRSRSIRITAAIKLEVPIFTTKTQQATLTTRQSEQRLGKTCWVNWS